MASQNSNDRQRMAHYPVIDRRNMERLTEQVKRLAKFYTPEWRFNPDDPDPGTALTLMLTHLLDGNIRRLNQVPYKSFLAFLNTFHVQLAPAKPAVAQVTFTLDEDAPESVYVTEGTQLSAQVPGEPEPILFETMRPVLLTTARLLDLFVISPKRDRIVQLADERGELSLTAEGHGTALFGLEGDNLQEHAFYMQHDFLFLLYHPAVLEFTVYHSPSSHSVPETVQLLTDTTKVAWEYYSEGRWQAFDRVYGSGATIRLLKLRERPLDETEVCDISGRWIRCRAFSLDEETGNLDLGKIQLDHMVMKSDYASPDEDQGIEPDRLYFNDIQLDTAEGFEPFGEFFALYGLFYISNREAFSKRGANITMKFDLAFARNRYVPDKPPEINWKLIMKRHEMDKIDIPDPVTILNVQWEYWNGTSWVKLHVNKEAQEMFSIPWEGVEPREITFRCPEDLEPMLVNAEENFWIRGRILQIQNYYSPNAIYYTPIMHRLRIRYAYEKPLYPPQHLMTINNLEVKDRSAEIASGGISIRPFTALEGSSPALWFRFDQPPERGPISMYVHLKAKRAAEEDIPFIEWEYLMKNGSSAVWSPLPVADETAAFTRSGNIQFIGPRDFANASYFGQTGYWIRAVNRDNRYDREDEARNVPRALDVVMNTVLVVQQETVDNEFPQRVEQYDISDGHLHETFVLSRTPVLDEEVWVDETDSITNEELAQLEQKEGRVDVVRDSGNAVMRVWVRYDRVEHFLDSSPRDRHYIIDRVTGSIQFGNSFASRRGQASGDDMVRVSYRTGGGKRGNVPAHTITSMQDSLSFVSDVTNMLPASGGCDPGTVEEAIRKGPKLFTHRNRAVTADDFAWLVQEAHPNVAKVKVLPNRNVKLERETGTLSIVVLPKSGIGDANLFYVMKKEIEAKLSDKVVSVIAPQSLQVMEPALLEVGVQAVVWVRNMDSVVPVERAVLEKLQAFLDPIHGNTDGGGWEIGEPVHASMFYALLKSISEVTNIARLSLNITKVENGERIEWHPDKLHEVPHGIIVPGEHRVIVDIAK